MSSTTQLGGLGSLILLLVGLLCSCCYCYMKCRRRQGPPREERHPRSMVYSVTMQGETGELFLNSVADYLRNTQTNEANSDSVRQRQINESLNGEKYLNPTGLPSYDDVISGKFDGREPPPPYSETNCSTSEASTSQTRSSS